MLPGAASITVGAVYNAVNKSAAGFDEMKGRRSGWRALLSQEGSAIEPQARSREGWFRSRIVTRLAWEPPLARSRRARAALLTQEGAPPAPTAFRQTRAVHFWNFSEV
jgi:hypothetical protein